MNFITANALVSTGPGMKWDGCRTPSADVHVWTVTSPESRSSIDPISVVSWLRRLSSRRLKAEQARAMSEMHLTDLAWSRPIRGSEGWQEEIACRRSLGRQGRWARQIDD